MATVPDAYRPLARPVTPLEQLTEFLTARLEPMLEEIRQMHARCDDRGTLFELGHRASALRLECTRWLRTAREVHATEQATQAQAVWETSEADRRRAGTGTRSERAPAAVMQAKIKDRTRTTAATVEFLRETRDDLADIMTFVQTGLRTMRDDELGSFEGAASVSGLWSAPVGARADDTA